MATATCPSCGTQYVATVRTCVDCGDSLVVEEDTDTAGRTERGERQVGYELPGWGNQLKQALEGMLDRAGINRAWEAGALVVDATDAATVDDLIATVAGDDAEDLEEEGRVALEIPDLDPVGHDELDSRLLAGGISHRWDDDGALVVTEADEERVVAMIEAVLDGDFDEHDSATLGTALSDLYVATDRLTNKPTDRKVRRSYRRAADVVVELPVPYGYTAEDWDSLTAEVRRLLESVGPGETESKKDDRRSRRQRRGRRRRAAPATEAKTATKAADRDDDEVEVEDVDGDEVEVEVEGVEDADCDEDEPEAPDEDGEHEAAADDDADDDHVEDDDVDDDSGAVDGEPVGVEAQARALRARLAELI